jgi:hypothetical protein
MHVVLVATRKGLFAVRGAGTRWTLGAPHFAGEPVSQVLTDPRDGAWYAALRLGHFGVKLHRSDDGGARWQEVAAPVFPPKPASGPWAADATPWNVDLVWSLAAGGADEPGALWAGCLPAGLFRSIDRGASWSLNEPLWHEPRRKDWFGGGYDHAGIHSIVVDPRDSRHVTLAISCGGVWQTHDRGTTWELTASGMHADFMPPERADDGNIQDPHRLVQCAAAPDTLWVQHHGGLYRSTDGARHWQALAPTRPTGFGFAVACHPRDPGRAWFVPAEADSKRIPIDGKVVVSRTDDGGRSFTIFGEGLPAQDAYHLVYRHALDVAGDGSTLAMASTTGALWTSADAGASWHCVSRDLPPVAAVRFA